MKTTAAERKGLAPTTPQPTVSGQPTPPKAKAPAKKAAAAWLVPLGLILLSVIPLAGGAFRLTQLAGAKGMARPPGRDDKPIEQ